MSQATVFSIEEELRQHKEAISKLEVALEEAKLEPPDQQLAKELHSMLCTWNHEDGCGWYYEITNKKDDWSKDTHGRYLSKARSLMHKCKEQRIDLRTAIDLLKLVKSI